MENQDFLQAVKTLLQQTNEKGAVYLTQKPSNGAVLVRASNGKHKERAKFSTTVPADAMEEFYAAFTKTCKENITKLKKRERKEKRRKKR